MKAAAYTLEQLALVNRCLFPGDVRERLIELGVDPFIALDIESYLKRRRNIVGLYQEYIECDEYKEAIGLYLDDFFKDADMDGV